MKELNKEHLLKLTAESPITILADSGSDLSPYSDYIVSENGNFLYYVNQNLVEKKFAEKIEKNPSLIDEYTNGVRLGMNGLDKNRSTFELKSFLQNKLGISLSDLKKVKTIGNWVGNKINLKTISKEAGRLYIPGSSLKGAFRTAILFDWFVNSIEGKKEISKLQKSLSDLIRNIDNNGLRESINREKRNVFDEEILFGKLNPSKGETKTAPLSQYLICRDSQSISDNKLEATFAKGIRRKPLKLGAKESVIPMPREAITKGAIIQTYYSIRLNQIPKTHHLLYLESETDKLLKVINQFSKAFIVYEIEKLCEYKPTTKDLKSLLDFYEKLLLRIENGEHFLRIGSGKTFYDNSLILTFLTHEDENIRFKAIENFKKIFIPNDKRPLHPINRTISAEGLPFGWLKIEAIRKFSEIEDIEEQVFDEIEVPKVKEKPQPLYSKKTLKIGDTIEATIIKSGIPNRLKLHIRPDYEPEIDLTGYKSEFGIDKVSEIILVKINSLIGKGETAKVSLVGFVKFKY